jgi:hypothetical protein
MSETQLESVGRVPPEPIAHVVSMVLEPSNPASMVAIPMTCILEPLVSPCRYRPQR